MKQIFKILLLIITMIFINCSSTRPTLNENHITEVGHSVYCEGKARRHYSIRITKDSTFVISGTRVNKNLDKTLQFKTDENDWKKLIEILNVDDFKKLELGEFGNLAADGCIKNVYIKTVDSTYSQIGYSIGNIQDAKTLTDLIK